MLRNEINIAVRNVLNAIEKSSIADIVESAFSGSKERDVPKFLVAFKVYWKAAGEFGLAENQIVEAVELGYLGDARFWAKLVGEEDLRRDPEAIQIYENIRFAREHLPKILKLFKRDSDNVSTEQESAPGSTNQFELLTAIVIEERNVSTPQRIILMLESIDGLYNASAGLLGEKEGDLSVISCDSGGDKSFDFLGLAKVMDCVKEVIIGFWDRVIYFREDKTGKQLDLIANSLPIIERISNMNDRGELEPERAELLKRQVIESVNKFAKAGITIPEIDEHTVFNPRQLMRPEPKLLSTPPDSQLPETEDSSDKKPIFSKEQIEDPELRAYMEKMASDFLRKQEEDKKGEVKSKDNSHESEV